MDKRVFRPPYEEGIATYERLVGKYHKYLSSADLIWEHTMVPDTNMFLSEPVFVFDFK